VKRLGEWVHANRRRVLAVWALVFAVSLVVVVRGGDLSSGDIPGLESHRADVAASQFSAGRHDTAFVVVFTSKTLDPRDAPFREARDAALAPLRADPRVSQVTTRDDANPFLRARMMNANAHAETAFVTLRGSYRDAFAAFPEIRRKLASSALDIQCTGRIPYMHDLDATLEHDLIFAEAISLPLAVVVLLFVFRTAVAALVPVVSGALSVVTAIAIVTALSRVTDIAQYTINVTSLIGLGVAIDYSLFTVSRYREELARGEAEAAALATAVATAGRAVCFSGLAVGVGLAGLFFFEGSYLSAMGMGGSIVVVLSVLVAITFVPALLAALGPRIHAGALRKKSESDTSKWRTLAAWVMRRPVLVLVPVVLALATMARPFFHLSVATAEVHVLDQRAEARRAYDDLLRLFPDQVARRVMVVWELPNAPALNEPRIRALHQWTTETAKLPGVLGVESIVTRDVAANADANADADPDADADADADADGDADANADAWVSRLLRPSAMEAPIVGAAKELLVSDHSTLLYVRMKADASEEQETAVIRSIRARPSLGDGRLLVGGPGATDIDTREFMRAHAKQAIAFVVGVTIIALFFQLRSVLLPLKAVAMNFLSIGASFGMLVWFFQDGHVLAHEGRPLEPTLPVLLFCVMFGLSMDYEVLMLARIREEWDRTHDNAHAVAYGLEKTAGLVTSAAAIMICVFSAFALASVVLLRAVGVGMALAVLIDATLIRLFVVPATMRLLGSWNWWSPR
jgi:RND superfamily putative drug exporter